LSFCLSTIEKLGDNAKAVQVVVEVENLPPGTAAWLCTKDKYNLPMFSDVCHAETKAQQRTQCSLCFRPPPYCQMQCCLQFY
jgi:hypothetical protein